VRVQDILKPPVRLRDDVDLIVGDVVEGFPLGFCAAEGGGASEGEEAVFGREISVETEDEECEGENGDGVGSERGENRGRLDFCGGVAGSEFGVVDEPAGETARVDELENCHEEGDREGDGRHAGSEEEWSDDCAIEVVDEVEKSEEFMVEEGHAGAQERRGRSEWREESDGKSVDDEEHIERADTFGDNPGIAPRDVEAGIG
jgi:hypothetical protein